MKKGLFDSVLLGGTGYIGQYLGKKMLDKGLSVLSVGRSDSILDSVKNGRILYYLLGQNGPDFTPDTEIETLKRVLKNIDRKVTRRFVFFSSALVYGNTISPAKESDVVNPVEPYSKYKAACEQLILNNNLLPRTIDTVILRLSNVYGRRGNKGIIGIILKKIMNDDYHITLNGDGQQQRDYIFIDDVVNSVITVSNTAKPSGIVNISSGKSHTLLEVVSCFNKLLSNRIQVSINGNKLNETVLSQISNDKLINVYGYSPTVNIYEGLNITIQENAKN